jgi:hypothetical protein
MTILPADEQSIGEFVPPPDLCDFSQGTIDNMELIR